MQPTGDRSSSCRKEESTRVKDASWSHPCRPPFQHRRNQSPTALLSGLSQFFPFLMMIGPLLSARSFYPFSFPFIRSFPVVLHIKPSSGKTMLVRAWPITCTEPLPTPSLFLHLASCISLPSSLTPQIIPLSAVLPCRSASLTDDNIENKTRTGANPKYLQGPGWRAESHPHEASR